MRIESITIKAEGELDKLPDIAEIIQSCVKLHDENKRETGDLFFDKLHVTYSYAEHTRKKKAKKEKE